VKHYIDYDFKLAASGSKQSDVLNITLRREELDSNDQTIVSKVSLQVTVPKGSDIDSTDIGNDISNLMCLFQKDFTSAMLTGIFQSGDYSVTGPFNPVRA
jgi:hypothetical protein